MNNAESGIWNYGPRTEKPGQFAPSAGQCQTSLERARQADNFRIEQEQRAPEAVFAIEVDALKTYLGRLVAYREVGVDEAAYATHVRDSLARIEAALLACESTPVARPETTRAKAAYGTGAVSHGVVNHALHEANRVAYEEALIEEWSDRSWPHGGYDRASRTGK